MHAGLLLNLLNKLGKRDKRGFAKHFIAFSQGV